MLAEEIQIVDHNAVVGSFASGYIPVRPPQHTPYSPTPESILARAEHMEKLGAKQEAERLLALAIIAERAQRQNFN